VLGLTLLGGLAGECLLDLLHRGEGFYNCEWV
jgi:hypothetical protein